MKQLLCVLCLAIFVSCTNKNNVKGTYKSVDDSALFESITFDGKVATFGKGLIGKLMPAYNYEVKNQTIYIKTHEGVLTFEVVNANTIKGKVSIVRGDIYKKQK